MFRESPGQLQFPVGSLDDARALVSDLALAERIETPDGTTVYRPERVLLTVGDGVIYPFKAPLGWHDRIRALDGFVRFGPRYRPAVLEALLAMDTAVRDGWSVGAYDHLAAALGCRVERGGGQLPSGCRAVDGLRPVPWAPSLTGVKPHCVGPGPPTG